MVCNRSDSAAAEYASHHTNCLIKDTCHALPSTASHRYYSCRPASTLQRPHARSLEWPPARIFADYFQRQYRMPVLWQYLSAQWWSRSASLTHSFSIAELLYGYCSWPLKHLHRNALLRQIKAARCYLEMPAHCCSIANQLNFLYGVGSLGRTPVLFTAHCLASKVNLAC